MLDFGVALQSLVPIEYKVNKEIAVAIAKKIKKAAEEAQKDQSGDGHIKVWEEAVNIIIPIVVNAVIQQIQQQAQIKLQEALVLNFENLASQIAPYLQINQADLVNDPIQVSSTIAPTPLTISPVEVII